MLLPKFLQYVQVGRKLLRNFLFLINPWKEDFQWKICLGNDFRFVEEMHKIYSLKVFLALESSYPLTRFYPHTKLKFYPLTRAQTQKKRKCFFQFLSFFVFIEYLTSWKPSLYLFSVSIHYRVCGAGLLNGMPENNHHAFGGAMFEAQSNSIPLSFSIICMLAWRR